MEARRGEGSTAESEMRIILGGRHRVHRLPGVVQLICNIVASMIKYFTAFLFLLLLIVWYCGGILPWVLVGLAVSGILYNGQDLLLFFPHKPDNARVYVEMPSKFNLPYEKFFIETADETRISVVLIKQPEELFSNATTMIFFHGNAGNIGHRMLNAYKWWYSIGSNILMVEYRGYGNSDGAPSETGFYRDAEAAMDYLIHRKDIDTGKIIVFGRSLGGAVAIYLASRPYYASNILGLIVENTFTSISEMAAHLVGISLINYLPSFCIKNQFDSLKRIKQVTVPALFLTGLNDHIIPPRMMSHLYNSATKCKMKRLSEFPTGTHNEMWMCDGYFETIEKFLLECLNIKMVHSESRTFGRKGEKRV